MVERNYFHILSDEEKAKYKFGFCEGCPFYECELVGEYTQFRESHAKINKPLIPAGECVDADSFGGGTVNQGTAVSVECNGEDSNIYSTNSCPIIDTDSSDVESLSYDQSKLKDGCIMSYRHVYQVECGNEKVTDGIGDHFQIEIDDNGNIKENIENRWESLQPVFISAQTGKGKNYFIEKTLMPYVRELNYKGKINYKILIFSNRLALKWQIKNRIDENGNNDLDDEGKIYHYNELADVMTYQSLLKQEKRLKKIHSRYIYVICDEAHFFTSDAMFNPHTHKILERIVRLFQNAVRVYMSATPYECLEYITKCEEEEQKRLNHRRVHSPMLAS